MDAAHVAPYAGLASSYDVALGRDSLVRIATALRRLIEHYRIGFRSAADIGCGTGLFAAHLARRWRVPVFAVDRSAPMLKEAVRNGSAAHVRLLCQDIRRLRLPRPVDLITANFDTLNHIVSPADLVATFARVRANLCPGGHFLFDVITDRQPWHPAQIYVERLPGAGCELVRHLRWDPLRRLIFIALSQRWRKRGIRTLERHVERAYAGGDIIRWLRRCGFSIRAVLDAATLEDAHGGSGRIVVVARRI
jgi:SAM-dependent methyltransferase